MNSKVYVVADENGNVIRQSKNPEYGYVRIVQDRITINEKDWVEKKTFSALLKGKIKDLESMGIKTMRHLPGNIIVVESTEPFDNDPTRNLKIAGETGIVLCTADGEPIYRTTKYDASGCREDVLVQHGNVEELRRARVNEGNTTNEEPVNQTSFDFDALGEDNVTDEVNEEPEDVLDQEDLDEEYSEEIEEIEFEIE